MLASRGLGDWLPGLTTTGLVVPSTGSGATVTAYVPSYYSPYVRTTSAAPYVLAAGAALLLLGAGVYVVRRRRAVRA